MEFKVGDELFAASSGSEKRTSKAIVTTVGRKFIHFHLPTMNDVLKLDKEKFVKFPVSTGYPHDLLIFESKDKYLEYQQYVSDRAKLMKFFGHGGGIYNLTSQQLKDIIQILGI